MLARDVSPDAKGLVSICKSIAIAYGLFGIKIIPVGTSNIHAKKT